MVRLLAYQLTNGNGYGSLGTWLEQLSDIDLQMLVEASEATNIAKNAETIVLLTTMLATAEGIEVTDVSSHEQVSFFILTVMCESLFRKQLVEFDRSIVSLDSSVINSPEPIAWKKGEPKPVRK